MQDLLDIKSDCLRPCADAFHANMTRTAVFSFMPASITWERIRDSVAVSNAQLRVTGTERPLRSFIFKQPADPFFALVQVETEQQLGEYSKWTKEERNAAYWNAGVMVVEQQVIDPSMRTSIQALLTSVILESWLFFEALISDLWVVAVDNSKGLISGRVANSTAQFKKPDENLQVQNMESNFKTHPGSFWREAGKVSFQTKKDILLFIGMAFGSEILQLLNNELWTLQSFRNCITHSAGKVDAGFKKQVIHSVEFRDLPLKSQLPLDGALVAKLRNASLIAGSAVLKKIDEMLQRGD